MDKLENLVVQVSCMLSAMHKVIKQITTNEHKLVKLHATQ